MFKQFSILRIFNLIGFLRDPIKFQEKLLKKYGDPFPMALPGQPVFWLTQDPKKVKEVFTAPPHSFRTSPHNPVLPLLGENGLIMQSGNRHSENRKNFVRFFSSKGLEKFPEIIESIFNKMTCDIDIEKKFHLQNFTQEITLKIIIEFLFPSANLADKEKLEHYVTGFCKSYLPFYTFIPKWFPFTWKPFLRNKKKLDRLLLFCFKKELEVQTSSIHSELSAKENNEILDQLRTLIIAGHETTAVSLTWSLYQLANKKELLNELRLSNDINQSLKSYIKEVQRCYPPVPFIMRKLNQDLKLSETCEFKANEEIGVSISLLHKNEKYWPSPDHILLERFIGPIENVFSYAPYGGGNRKCLGATLADMELNIITKLFMQKFNIDVISKRVVKQDVLQITLGPKKPISLKLSLLNL